MSNRKSIPKISRKYPEEFVYSDMNPQMLHDTNNQLQHIRQLSNSQHLQPLSFTFKKPLNNLTEESVALTTKNKPKRLQSPSEMEFTFFSPRTQKILPPLGDTQSKQRRQQGGTQKHTIAPLAVPAVIVSNSTPIEQVVAASVNDSIGSLSAASQVKRNGQKQQHRGLIRPPPRQIDDENDLRYSILSNPMRTEAAKGDFTPMKFSTFDDEDDSHIRQVSNIYDAWWRHSDSKVQEQYNVSNNSQVISTAQQKKSVKMQLSRIAATNSRSVYDNSSSASHGSSGRSFFPLFSSQQESRKQMWADSMNHSNSVQQEQFLQHKPQVSTASLHVHSEISDLQQSFANRSRASRANFSVALPRYSTESTNSVNFPSQANLNQRDNSSNISKSKLKLNAMNVKAPTNQAYLFTNDATLLLNYPSRLINTLERTII